MNISPPHSPQGDGEPPSPEPSPDLACEVVIQNPCRYPEAGARRHRAWLESLVADLAPDAGSFVLRFVSDREMRRLQRDFRQRDTTTDVLSFPADDGDPLPGEDGGGRDLGDVVISVPQARRQADGKDVERELRVLALHGLLHCLGYDHETDDGTMERLEVELRRRWVSGRPLGGSEGGQHR